MNGNGDGEKGVGNGRQRDEVIKSWDADMEKAGRRWVLFGGLNSIAERLVPGV